MGGEGVGGKLQAVWSNCTRDLSSGENVELYGLSLVALAFAVVGFFTEPVRGVAFAIATMYVSQLIRERHQRTELRDAVAELAHRVEGLIERIDSPQLDREWYACG